MKIDIAAKHYSLQEARQILAELLQLYDAAPVDSTRQEQLLSYLQQHGFYGLALAIHEIVHLDRLTLEADVTLEALWSQQLRRPPFDDERQIYSDLLRFLGPAGKHALIERMRLAQELRQQATELLDADRFGKAEALLKEAVERGIPSWEVYHDLGLVLARQGKYRAAIPTFKKAIEQNVIDHNWVYSCEELRDCYDHLGKDHSRYYQQGIEYFSTVSERFPQRWIALHECGYLNWQKGDLKEAMRCYYRAVEQKNDESWGWSTRDLFSCYMALPDRTDAFHFFRELAGQEPYHYFLELTERHPRDWGAWHNLAWWEWNMPDKDSATAVDSYRQAIHLHPGGGWYWSWQDLGWCLDQQGRHVEAFDVFQQCVAINPDHWEAWHGLGSAAYHKESWGEAITAYQTAVRLNPESEWSWHGLGKSYADKPDPHPLSAWRAQKRALIARPDFQEAQDAITALGSQPWTELRQILSDRVSTSELRVICLDLEIRYADLAGETHTERIISLIEQLKRTDSETRLIEWLNRERPEILPVVE